MHNGSRPGNRGSEILNVSPSTANYLNNIDINVSQTHPLCCPWKMKVTKRGNSGSDGRFTGPSFVNSCPLLVHFIPLNEGP
jgi:hypothetical protein